MIAQLPESEIASLLESYENVSKQLRDNMYRIVWYMRGGVSYTEIMHDVDIADYEIINQIIKENWEATNKAGMPLV